MERLQTVVQIAPRVGDIVSIPVTTDGVLVELEQSRDGVFLLSVYKRNEDRILGHYHTQRVMATRPIGVAVKEILGACRLEGEFKDD